MKFKIIPWFRIGNFEGLNFEVCSKVGGSKPKLSMPTVHRIAVAKTASSLASLSSEAACGTHYSLTTLMLLIRLQKLYLNQQRQTVLASIFAASMNEWLTLDFVLFVLLCTTAHPSVF